MTEYRSSRREVIKKWLQAASFLISGGLIAGACGESAKPGAQPNSCTDLNNVSKEELEKRKKLGYVESTPMPENFCGNCKLFLPPVEGAKCGGCQLFKGPVETKGYCAYFAPMDKG
jgi:hypothetical protein